MTDLGPIEGNQCMKNGKIDHLTMHGNELGLLEIFGQPKLR